MKKIILKYLSNEATFQEQEQLKNWLKNPDNRNKFKEYLKIHYNLNKALTSVNIEKAYRKFLSDIQPKGVKNLKDKNRAGSLVFLKYAAIFVGILGVGFGIMQYLFESNISGTTDQNVVTLQLDDGTIIELENVNSQTLYSFGHNINLSNQDKILYSEDSLQTEHLKKFNTLSVPYGKNFTVVLSDGSEVVLNAGSKLTYPIVFFKDDVREVQLEGEAFFNVKKGQHPFIVNTEQMGVTVLGTSFNITAYRDINSITSVVLVTGNINAFSRTEGDKNNKNISLIPGERAIIEEGTIKKGNVEVDKYIAWTSGRLIFIDDSFETITRKLERKYDVSIINFYPQLQEIAITGNFKSENIEEVLKTFQQHTPFNFIRDGRKITITPPKIN